MPSRSARNAHSQWTLFAYGCVALPWCLAGLPILTYVPAFYAQELQLSAGLVGLVFLCARLWDGIFDVLLGWLSDRSTSRYGRRKPWVVLGAPLLMAATWFLCNPPQGAGVGYLCIWAAVFYTTWSTIGIPYISWGAELATDYVERSRVTASREIFTMLGNLVFAVAPMVLLPVGAPLQDAVSLIAITVLLLLPVTVAVLATYVPDRVPTEQVRAHLLAGLTALTRDRVLVRFILLTLVIWTANGAANSLFVFALDVGLQLKSKLFVLIFVTYIAAMCTAPVTVHLTKHVEKHHLLMGALAMQALASCSLVWVPAGHFGSVIAALIGIGVAMGPWLILPGSMLADIIDHAEVANGERHPGTYVAICNLAVKIGLALGVGLAFGLLDFVGYNPSINDHGAVDVRNIRLLGFALPAMLLVAGAILLLQYPITKKLQRQLREQIDRRESDRASSLGAKLDESWRTESAPISR
jgi:GPH family glycoside/pentoside/hexuronide:cation symporter